MSIEKVDTRPATGVGAALDTLSALEAEGIHILREAVATSRKPVILFSGGKDSVVVLHLATKAFWPGRVPIELLHVDTGHNFDEVLAFRDATVERLGLRLQVASVQSYIDDGRLRERPDGMRNTLQTVPLLDGITRHGYDVVFGGARRDEEKARAKERVVSLRDEFGQWDPRNQRPELWNLYNTRHLPGQHVRVFPLSNWTELDVWRYIERENIALPSLYYAHERPGLLARWNVAHSPPRGSRWPGRRRGDQDRQVPDGRGRLVHGRGGIRRRDGRRGHRGSGRNPHHRAGRHSRG